MRSKFMLLLASLATLALWMVPSMAAADPIITLSANGRPLPLGTEITGTSNNTKFELTWDQDIYCAPVEFNGELLSNETDDIAIGQIAYVEFSDICEGPYYDIKVLPDTFLMGVGAGNVMHLYPERYMDKENVYDADLGAIQFSYQRRLADGGSGWQNCGTVTGGAGGAWASAGSFSLVAYSAVLSGQACGPVEVGGWFHDLAVASTGDPISITISEE